MSASVISERLRTSIGVIGSGRRRTPNPKPSLDAVMSQAQLEKKVADYLRNSQALGGLLATPDYRQAVAG